MGRKLVNKSIKQIGFQVDSDVHKKLKMHALKNGLTLKELMLNAAMSIIGSCSDNEKL